MTNQDTLHSDLTNKDKRCYDHSFETSKVIVFLAGVCWWYKQSMQKAVSANGSASRVCLHTCFIGNLDFFLNRTDFLCCLDILSKLACY